MNYLKNLTLKQWVIIFSIVLFFAISLFLFMKEPVDQQRIDIEKLLNQGTAPMTSEDNIGRDKLQKFLNPDVSTVWSSSTVKEITDEQKNDLFKLMSAPKSQ